MSISSWRDHLEVHPACELFPRMLPDELRKLGEDICKNDLLEPIKYVKRDGRIIVVDGQNRLDAMELVGLPVIENGCMAVPNDFVELDLETDAEIADYVIAANIRRRHLKAADKDRLIADLIKLDSTKSNRQIAKQTESSPTTVGRVRDKVEAAGDVSTMDTRTDTKGRQQPSRKKSTRRGNRLGVPKWNEPSRPLVEELPVPTEAVTDVEEAESIPDTAGKPAEAARVSSPPTDPVTEERVSWIVTCLQNAIDAKSRNTALMHLDWAADGLARVGGNLFALLNVPALKPRADPTRANSTNTANTETDPSSSGSSRWR